MTFFEYLFHSLALTNENGMTMEEFCVTLSKLPCCHGLARQSLAQLFMKIDTSCDNHVDWDEFCSYMLTIFEECDGTEARTLDSRTAFLSRANNTNGGKMNASASVFLDGANCKTTPKAHPTAIACLKFVRFESQVRANIGTIPSWAGALPKIASTSFDTSAANSIRFPKFEKDKKHPIGEFLSLSNDGLVSVWDSSASLRRQFPLHISIDPTHKSSMPWVADMVIIPSIRRAIVAFMNRCDPA